MTSAARVLTLVLACLLLIALGAWWRGVTWTDVRHWGTPRNVIEADGQTVRIPIPEGDPDRVLPRVRPDTFGDYAFLFPDEGPGGGPVRYDPCRPLEYVISPAHMPDGFEPLIHEAVASVSAATGLSFMYAGTTDEPVSFDRELVQERYGDGFAPIIVGFSSARENGDLHGSITGLGGSSAVPGAYGDSRYLRAGVVILDYEDVGRIAAEPGGTRLARAVVAHEMGHVVGLAHVDSNDELMHESNLRLVEWGPGDLMGLAVAGSGLCEST